MKAKRSRRCQDFGLKSIPSHAPAYELDVPENVQGAIDDLPEGTNVETLPDGKLSITVQAKRSEADEARRQLVEIAESNGLTIKEGKEDVLLQ